MIQLTLAQMRQSLPRLTGAGVAVLIGTAFITMTLLANIVLTQTTTATLSAQFGEADLVVVGSDITTEEVDAVRQVPGVAAADPVGGTFVQLAHGNSQLYQYSIPAPSDPQLTALAVDSGRYPQAPGQIALPANLADRFDVSVGGQLEATWTSFAGDQVAEHMEELTVVGIVSDPRNAFGSYGGASVLDADQFAAWNADGSDITTGVSVLVSDGTDPQDLRPQLVGAFDDSPEVMTPDDYAAELNRSLTGGQDVFVGALLAFAAIALVVAALVIANTFQVLVAHRSRTLALLRAVGATRRQLYRSVVVEGTLVGGVASLLGFALGCVVGQATLSIATRIEVGGPIPTMITLTPVVVLVPILVGTVVTVIACTAPARSTRHVTPLEALRPIEIRDGRRAGRVRLAAFIAITAVGFAVLATGISLGRSGFAEAGIGLAIVGGAVSFTGLVLGGVYWLPVLVGLVGRLASRTGPVGRLAAANTLRNPRRTSATSAALLIGVTLVATMATGAISARASANAALSGRYPIDLEVSTVDLAEGSPMALPPEVIDQITALPGVTAVATIRGTELSVDGSILSERVVGVDSTAWSAVTRDPASAEDLTNETIVLPPHTASTVGATDGDTVTVAGPTGASSKLTVQVASSNISGPMVTGATLDRVAPRTPVTALFVRIADDAVSRTVGDVEDIAVSSPSTLSVYGPANDRATIDHIIDVILGVVICLLAIAVLIALIGVTNTLSLSVLERRRESATLRAIGLTRRQLRQTLALEGLLIAGVGALSGTVIGVCYGWAGALAALSVMGEVSLAVPWRDLALLMTVALAAGWLASVVPARAATRASPVASLAHE